MGDSNNKIVFISYSHDSEAHRERVLGLSERLRLDGLNTALDQYINGAPAEGWPRWMMDRLDEATHVLVICTETYYRRFRGHEIPGIGRGVDWEGSLITHELYDARSKTCKFVPVLFDDGNAGYIPEPLRGGTHYMLATKENYQALYDFLMDQAGVEARPIGEPTIKLRRKGEPLIFLGEDSESLSLRQNILPEGGYSKPYYGNRPALSSKDRPLEPPPESLIYLTDRSRQYDLLMDKLDERYTSDPKGFSPRPLICVLPGYGNDDHHGLCKGFTEIILPKRAPLLGMSEICQLAGPSWHDDMVSLNSLLRTVTDELRLPPKASTEDICAAICRRNDHLVFCHMLACDNWRDTKKSNVRRTLYEWLNYWLVFPDVTPSQLLIIFICLRYGETTAKVSIPWPFRSKQTLAKQIAEELSQNCNGDPDILLLPALERINSIHVADWAETIVTKHYPYFDRHVLRKNIQGLFASENEEKSMRDIKTPLIDCLNDAHDSYRKMHGLFGSLEHRI